MRYSMVILIAVTVIIFSIANAEEVILGTVISADRDTGTLIIRVIDRSDIPAKIDTKPEDIMVIFEKGSLPDSVTAETPIRIWGRYIKGETVKFQAVKITSDRLRNQKDPTGVRSRLRQRDYRMPQSPPRNRGPR